MISKYFSVAKNNLELQSVVTLITLVINTLTFYLVTVLIIFALLSNYVLGYLESRAQLTVYFKDTVNEEYILNVKADLIKNSNISDVAYTSKEDALKLFLNLYQNEPLLTESVDAGIFPASLDIRVKDISTIDYIANSIKSKEGVEEISYFKEALDKFKSWSTGIKYVGVTIVGVMLFISFLIVLVFTGVSIKERSEEIRIMRLLGATDSYITGPFFAQSILISILSTIFSMVLLLSLIPFVEPFVLEKFAGIPIPTFDFIKLAGVFVVVLLINLFVSLFGTAFGVKKYMNF